MADRHPPDPREILTALAGRRLKHVPDTYRVVLHSLSWGSWKNVPIDEDTRRLLHELVDGLPAVEPLPTDPEVLAAQAHANGWVSRQSRRFRTAS